ncbi:MAG: zf-HC2 domain-containing protein [Thermoleophilia bacterium]|nr:zf-HC2 domain-containing protein [Thermoleophilia bacterium]
MAGAHPNEIVLLEYVEGDLAAPDAAGVRSHLETCTACAATIAELELARDALRAAPLLELPAGRLDELVAGLPERERERRRLPGRFSARRLGLVLVPVAAAATAVAIAVTTTGDGAQPEASRSADTELAMVEAAPAEAEEAGAEDAGAAEAPVEEPPPPYFGALVASVGETPEHAVELLVAAGLDAEISDRVVIVYGGSEEQVRKALEGVPEGDTAVYLAPPR